MVIVIDLTFKKILCSILMVNVRSHMKGSYYWFGVVPLWLSSWCPSLALMAMTMALKAFLDYDLDDLDHDLDGLDTLDHGLHDLDHGLDHDLDNSIDHDLDGLNHYLKGLDGLDYGLGSLGFGYNGLDLGLDGLGSLDGLGGLYCLGDLDGLDGIDGLDHGLYLGLDSLVIGLESFVGLCLSRYIMYVCMSFHWFVLVLAKG